jgi:hypothetical protein
MRYLLVGLGVALAACEPMPEEPYEPYVPPEPTNPNPPFLPGTCAPGVACQTIPDRLIQGIAVRGTHLGLVTGRLEVFQGGELVGESTELVRTAVGVPTAGWLVASGSEPVTFSTLDVRGETTRTQSLDIHTSPEMVYGPSDRVLLAWMEVGAPAPRMVHVAIASADGTIEVPASAAFEAPWTQVSVATDGTNFFAAADRSVARITPDGVVTVHGDFPLAGTDGFPLWARVASDAAGGWYVAAGDAIDPKYIAQRFDATGAPVGDPLRPDVDGLVDVVADGDDLLLLTLDSVPDSLPFVRIRRLSPDGTMSAPRDVGRGLANFDMEKLGPNVVVGWVADLAGGGFGTYLATVAP